MASSIPGGTKWSAAETEQLTSLASDYPWDLVVRHYTHWASCNGYPARSRSSMQNRLRRLGYTIACVGQYVSTSTIQELASISDTTISRWCRQGSIRCFRQGKKIYISRESLKNLARKRPECFAGQPYSKLYQLLESKELAEHLSSLPIVQKPGTRCPVRCIETGFTYRCAMEAGKAHWCTRSAIHWAVKTGNRAAGYHWERVA
jgi:hypothetical protein